MTHRVFGAWRDWDTAHRQLAVLAPEVSAQRLGEAVAFAEEAHGDQKRPAGELYVEHLLEVVEILVSGAGVREEDLLVAAAAPPEVLLLKLRTGSATCSGSTRTRGPRSGVPTIARRAATWYPSPRGSRGSRRPSSSGGSCRHLEDETPAATG